MWEVTLSFENYKDAEAFVDQVLESGEVLVDFGNDAYECGRTVPCTIVERSSDSL